MFVVSEFEGDYNDEYFFLEKSVPVATFEDKKSADKFALYANGDRIAELNLSYWGTDYSDVTSLDEESFNAAIRRILGVDIVNAFDDVDFNDYELSRKQKTELVGVLDELCFFEVTKVPHNSRRNGD